MYNNIYYTYNFKVLNKPLVTQNLPLKFILAKSNYRAENK